MEENNRDITPPEAPGQSQEIDVESNGKASFTDMASPRDNNTKENITGKDNEANRTKPNAMALLPILVFLGVYLGASLISGDFYKMPIASAFVITAVTAVAVSRRGNIATRVEDLCRGAANGNIMLMVLIFILAGAFAATAEGMGAVDSAVNLALSVCPPGLLTVGLFLAACFISISVGTSVGTVVALAPVAAGIAAQTDMSAGLMVGVAVSGAMFGDNLSFISDTTIVATRTQGVEMADKFRVNVRIALPAAIVTAILFWLVGKGGGEFMAGDFNWVKVLPYLIVLGTAIAGINVLLVLTIGIASAGIIGLSMGDFSLMGWMGWMGGGITSMGELIIVTLLAGGIFESMRANGGIDWLIMKLTSRIRSRKGAEASIGALSGLADICTANNTVALVMTGPIAKDIADHYGVDPRRSASIIDIFSCVAQGLIPYGAQILMAAGLAYVSPMDILPWMFYPLILGLAAIISILTGYPGKYTKRVSSEQKKKS